jgi:hypothetical protein
MRSRLAKNSPRLNWTLTLSVLGLFGCASLLQGPVDNNEGSFSYGGRVLPNSLASEISTNLLEVDPAFSNTPVPALPSPGQVARDPAGLTNPVFPQETTIVPANARTIYYKIKPNDTLMQISFKFLGNPYRWREIYRLNQDKIANYNRLPHGETISIQVFNEVKVQKRGRPYPIKRGDTLVKISNWLYGTVHKWRDLWKNNPQLIRDPNKIYAGFDLYYRGKSIRDKKQTYKAPASLDPANTSPVPVPLDKST